MDHDEDWRAMVGRDVGIHTENTKHKGKETKVQR